jgi:Domain of unknown function (DUF1906)
MKLVQLPHGALGFDCYTPPTADQLIAMRALGFVFHVGYLDNRTPEMVTDALAAGLLFVAVQVSRKSGWRPSASTGSEDGARARRDAIRLDLPLGVDIFRDLETPNVLTTLAEIQADSHSWCAEMDPGGYEGKVYVGAGMPPSLTSQALYELPYRGYWASFSRVPDVAHRGYQMRQLFRYPQGECRVGDVFDEAPALVSEMIIDVDVAFSDYKGGRVTAVGV